MLTPSLLLRTWQILPLSHTCYLRNRFYDCMNVYMSEQRYYFNIRSQLSVHFLVNVVTKPYYLPSDF